MKEESGLSILLHLDNVTAIAFLDRIRGTHSSLLSKLAVETWEWCLERKISPCRTPPRSGESAGRLAVETSPGFERLEAPPRDLPVAGGEPRSPHHRSFCLSHQPSAATILQLEARPRGGGYRRPLNSLEGTSHKHVPPVRADPR